MKKILVVCLCCLIAGWKINAQQPVYLNPSKSIEERVEDALSRMTMKEKVDLCHAQSKFSSKGVARLGIPEIWMADGPFGVKFEFSWDDWTPAYWTNDSCTALPSLIGLAASFDPDLSYKYGKVLGEEARYRKKDVILGPGVNIYRTPLCGRNFEYMGEDPLLASRMAVPYIKGLQENGVAACVKHFALNNQETRRSSVNIILSDRALHEIYLPAFKAAVQEGGAWTIMGSYNKYKGQYCCHNDYLLNQILKKSWGFDGVVVSDWSGVHDTMEAANNGLDIEMGTHTDGLFESVKNAYDQYYLGDRFYQALQRGEISEKVLNDKARRILRLIFRTSMNQNKPWGSFGTPEHIIAAREIAEQGIVLLKNEKNILPLRITGKKIAVIGENATRTMIEGGGSSGLKSKYELSPLKGIQNKYGKDNTIIHTMGYASGPAAKRSVLPSPYNADSLLNEALNVAKQADVVLFFGGLNKSFLQDREAGDRQEYELPFGQEKIIAELQKVNKNIIVILVSGNAVAMPWAEKIPAIVQAWYEGIEGGNAIANVLSGDVNPSGKLPISFPVKLTDIGAHAFDKTVFPYDSVNKKTFNVYYKEDIFVGYRWLENKKIKPQYPFGFGLSYTTFEINNINANKKTGTTDDVINVSFDIKNTGKVKGAEVLQVYVGQDKPSVPKALKELKAFRKVPLEAGVSTSVTIPVPTKSFAFYDEQTQNWKVEKGKYFLYVGTSSADILQKIEININ